MAETLSQWMFRVPFFSNDYSIGITGNRSASIGKRPKLKEEGVLQTTLDAAGKKIIPGWLICIIIFQTLCKGLGDDKSLFDWFRTADTFLYAQPLCEDDCYWAAMLGCLEARKLGVTCLNDFMDVHPKPSFRMQ